MNSFEKANAVWRLLGGDEGVDKLLDGRLIVTEPSRSWHEKDGVIYLSVTSDGTIGENWIARLESKGFRVEECVRNMLRFDFKPTSGVTTEVAILKGMLFENNKRSIKNILAEAKKRKLRKLNNIEVACLIREKLADKEIKDMGLWRISAMHKPIKGHNYIMRLLNIDRHREGKWLCTCGVRFDINMECEQGFVFAV